MEEFQEDEILWPELDQDYKEDCTKHDAHSGKDRTKQNMTTPILSVPKNRIGHTWTPGFNYRGHEHMQDDDGGDDDDEDDGDDYGGALNKGMVPPHVLISKRYTNKIASSVCVGNGRTLKGRDLRITRDSIHRMTGYIEK